MVHPDLGEHPKTKKEEAASRKEDKELRRTLETMKQDQINDRLIIQRLSAQVQELTAQLKELHKK